MNKKIKKGIYTSFLCIMMFFAGMFSQWFFQHTSQDNYIQSILEDENRGLYFDIWRSLNIAKKGGLDTACHSFLKDKYKLLQQIDEIANYFTDVLSSDKKLTTFSFDKIKSILGEDAYNRIFDDFHSIENSIDFKKSTILKNKIYINFYYNVILRRLFELYKTDSLIFVAGECVFHSKYDTVKVGDMYSTQIYFKVKDIQNTYRLEFENGDTFLGDIYTEKAIKTGVNKRKGNLIYFSGESEFHFPFEFSFYVK